MSARLLRQCLDALCPAGWSVQDAASLLRNLEGQPPKRETVRDWLTRDSVPAWVWPQVYDRLVDQHRLVSAALSLCLKRRQP